MKYSIVEPDREERTNSVSCVGQMRIRARRSVCCVFPCQFQTKHTCNTFYDKFPVYASIGYSLTLDDREISEKFVT